MTLHPNDKVSLSVNGVEMASFVMAKPEQVPEWRCRSRLEELLLWWYETHNKHCECGDCRECETARLLEKMV